MVRRLGDWVVASVRQDLKGDEFERILNQLPLLNGRLAAVAPKFPQRLTENLVRDVVHVMDEMDSDSARRMARDFAKNAEPVPYDPKFDRLHAFWRH